MNFVAGVKSTVNRVATAQLDISASRANVSGNFVSYVASKLAGGLSFPVAHTKLTSISTSSFQDEEPGLREKKWQPRGGSNAINIKSCTPSRKRTRGSKTTANGQRAR